MRYERPVPAAIGVAPRLKMVTLTGSAAPGNAALGIVGSMYGSWKKPFVTAACVRRRKPSRMLDPVAGARGLAAVRAHDVVGVAVALHVRRIRRDLHPGAVRRLLLVREGVRAERLDAELLELHRDDVDDAVLQRG